MRVVSACFVCGLILQVITQEINHALTPWALSVFTAGLPVAFAGLRLEVREGWRTVVLLGLCADALTPVHFGVHAILCLAVFSVLQNLRQRVPRDELIVGSLFAVLTNIGLHLALSVIYLWRGPSPSQMIERLFWEWGLSSLLLAVLAPWYFALIENLVPMFGGSLRREQRGLY